MTSVIPSSNRLAELITSEVDLAKGPVLELGPGTGVFTRSLIQRGVRAQDLTLIELGVEFADVLALRYPEVTIARLDAARLSAGKLAVARIHGAAISGLPLLSMPPRKVHRILSGAFRQLDTNACFYQFTYGWRCPVPNTILDRLGLKAERIGTVARWSLQRKQSEIGPEPKRANLALDSASLLREFACRAPERPAVRTAG